MSIYPQLKIVPLTSPIWLSYIKLKTTATSCKTKQNKTQGLCRYLSAFLSYMKNNWTTTVDRHNDGFSDFMGCGGKKKTMKRHYPYLLIILSQNDWDDSLSHSDSDCWIRSARQWYLVKHHYVVCQEVLAKECVMGTVHFLIAADRELAAKWQDWFWVWHLSFRPHISHIPQRVVSWADL